LVIATDSNLISSLHGITGRFGDAGFIIAYVLDTTGDNVRYRAYNSAGNPLYNLQTLTGTGNIDVSSGQGRFHLTIGERIKVADQNYTFAIKATSTNTSSGRIIALVEPTRFNPQTIHNTEIVSLSDALARYGQIGTTSPYELRLLKPNNTTDSMSLDVYVRQSILMGLWRIEEFGRFFRNTSYDNDAANLAESVFSNYPYQDMLLAPSGTSDASYTAAPGRSSVNPDTTSFASFWGTADEENVFIGGPKLSEIANSFENNPNMYDPQIAALSNELGFSALELFYLGRNFGWSYGGQTPEIRVTVSGNDYVLQRHVDSQDNARAVDYGLIVRLPLTSTDTQSTRAFVYIAGLNNIGTEAAAYAYKNFVQFHVGAALGVLVVIKYDSSLVNASTYNPATDGIIYTYPLSFVDSNDFEGIH
jgi:hypothetical protein